MDLPDDIVQRLTGYLNLKDLSRLTRVSHIFKDGILNKEGWCCLLMERSNGAVKDISGISLFCSVCFNAYIPHMRPVRLIKRRICHPCQTSSRYRRICVSRAKQTYGLTEKDLRGLPFIQAPNPHYRRAAPMRLYVLQDILDAAAAKENARKRKISQPETLEERRQRRKIAATERKTKRQEDLSSALVAKGLTLRSDSALCARYIANSWRSKEERAYWTVDAIVDRMSVMHDLYEHSCYEELLNVVFPEEFEDQDGRRESFDAFEWSETKDEMEQRALTLLRSTESRHYHTEAPRCPCGRKMLKEFVPVDPYGEIVPFYSSSGSSQPSDGKGKKKRTKSDEKNNAPATVSQ